MNTIQYRTGNLLLLHVRTFCEGVLQQVNKCRYVSTVEVRPSSMSRAHPSSDDGEHHTGTDMCSTHGHTSGGRTRSDTGVIPIFVPNMSNIAAAPGSWCRHNACGRFDRISMWHCETGTLHWPKVRCVNKPLAFVIAEKMHENIEILFSCTVSMLWRRKRGLGAGRMEVEKMSIYTFWGHV